ncbi:MAG: prephenate dehydratase domain-containing protein, partial [Candidatus Neomarinimicrobiota bacterium]
MIKIGIQGGEGSFCEEAADVFLLNHGLKDTQYEYLITSENVLAAIEKDSIRYGIFAMENAQGGVVIESVEALAEHKCKIVEMFYKPISQCLLTLPNILFGEITEIYSHPQALRQCREYLAEHFWTRPLIDADDTAEAARRLAQGKLPGTAAVIASQNCAELYGLTILQDAVHDLKNNITLF